MDNSFLPGEQFEIALEKLKLDLDAWKKLVLQGKHTQWQMWADPVREQILSSPRATLGFLDDPNPEVRLAAAVIIERHWPPSECFVSKCLYLAFADPDACVRAAAFIAVRRNQAFVHDPTGHLKGLISHLFGPTPPSVKYKARELFGKASELRARFEKMIRTKAEELAGVHFERMLGGKDVACEYLTNDNADLRIAAILVIDLCWKKEKAISPVIEKLAFTDPNDEVRLHALDTMIANYAYSNDDRVGRMLANLVSDSTILTRQRALAYWGLFALRGIPLSRRPKYPSAGIGLPVEVDWEFVNSFRSV